jgi:hypothetical protein
MIKRWWWLTLEERQRKFKKQKGLPEKEPKKRNPYRRGAKAYLASFMSERRENTRRLFVGKTYDLLPRT